MIRFMGWRLTMPQNMGMRGISFISRSVPLLKQPPPDRRRSRRVPLAQDAMSSYIRLLFPVHVLRIAMSGSLWNLEVIHYYGDANF